MAWETSHSAFASALADKIDEYLSSPEYTGSTDGPKLIITPTTGPGTGANGRSVVVGTVGTVTVTTTNLAGGVNTVAAVPQQTRSEEHTSELQSLMRLSYAVFCLKKKISK